MGLPFSGPDHIIITTHYLQTGPTMFSFTNSLSKDDPRHTPRHVVFGVVAKANKIACVACLDGSRGYFDLPGGGMKVGETEERAIVREFREETGLLVRPTKRLTQAGQYYLSSDGKTWRYSFGGLWPSG